MLGGGWWVGGEGLGVGLGLLVAKLLNLIIPIPSELLAWLRRVSKAENVDCVSHLKGQKGLLGQPSIILMPIGLLVDIYLIILHKI